MKWAIVVALEWLCGRLDNIPTPYRYAGRWHFGASSRGCALGLANLSADLDERWHTGVWH